MKRISIIGYGILLFASAVYAQEGAPAPPPVEQQRQLPAEHPGMSRSSPPSQAVVPVPVPMAPPKPNGPIQKSLVRITATAVDPDYKAPWNSGGLQRGVGAGFVISGNRIMTNAHVVANSRYITVERDGDPTRDFVLQGEQIARVAVEALGPQMRVCGSTDQLRVDSDLIARSPDASFQHVAHPQLAADLLCVDRLVPVRERGIPRDHEHICKSRQIGRQIFGDSICKILLLDIVAEIGEWQHDDRQARRKRRPGDWRSGQDARGRQV